MSDPQNTLTSNQVADYLRAHPAFFNDHLDLLEELSIPHPSGVAVSLISKQLEMLRNRNQEIEAQLASLIEIAKSNDTSFDRMHKLTLALLETSTLEEAVASLEVVLSDYFMTDFIAVRIITSKPDAALPHLFLAPDSAELEQFLAILAADQPKCGRPTLAQAKVLFGAAALEVQSAAIIPMKFADMSGILAIGSRSNERFHYSMGSFFLTHMSEIISARFLSLLSQKKYA
ncbi:DUF484 family protein [Methylomicrobium lacus]|uniref:DUF484 family protein n=1 Tax=Methylomicrobium lacus TaxID=136992 RepID=UPI00045E8BC7|nr:DUF484 family protein [Methylomicrobium lacus]